MKQCDMKCCQAPRVQHRTGEHVLVDFAPRIWCGEVRWHSTPLAAKAVFHMLYSPTATLHPGGTILSNFEKHNTIVRVHLWADFAGFWQLAVTTLAKACKWSRQELLLFQIYVLQAATNSWSFLQFPLVCQLLQTWTLEHMEDCGISLCSLVSPDTCPAV